jgi:hypothetical protein
MSGDIAARVSASADPVATPDAYRREILGWLGDDDPAAVAAGTVDRLRGIVAAAGSRLRERPAPGEWSVIECIGHLADAELVVGARMRWILAEDEPDIVGYDQDRWVDVLRHREDDPESLVELFEALRAANLRLWASTPSEARGRIGRHRERGPESCELVFRMLAGHDRSHVAQAERALEATAVGASRGPSRRLTEILPRAGSGS